LECHFVQNKHILCLHWGKQQQHNLPLIILTKSSLWRSDDGLISERNKAEVYLVSMESKHTTRFTRKKRAKKLTALFTFWPILALEALLLLYILDTIFCPLLMLYSYWHNDKCNTKDVQLNNYNKSLHRTTVRRQSICIHVILSCMNLKTSETGFK
jgi:hypothetical protein